MPDTQAMGRTGNPSEAPINAEPGATDNRLALDVNDPTFDFTKEWEDGKSYTFTNMRVTQVSPGEYEVLSAEEGTEPEGETLESRKGAMGVAGEATEPDTAPTGGTGYRNPAIAKLMAQ